VSYIDSLRSTCPIPTSYSMDGGMLASLSHIFFSLAEAPCVGAAASIPIAPMIKSWRCEQELCRACIYLLSFAPSDGYLPTTTFATSSSATHHSALNTLVRKSFYRSCVSMSRITTENIHISSTVGLLAKQRGSLLRIKQSRHAA
jgi:hypothetical protein